MNRRIVGLSVSILVGVATTFAAPPIDDEERDDQRARGALAVRENCLICHSDELISSQRLTPAQWQAEVDKMIGWGAPVPKEQAGALAAYLTETYLADALPAVPTRISYAEAFATIAPEPVSKPLGDPRRGAALYAPQCANCHGSLGQGAELGPNLVAISALLRPTEFGGVVRAGRRRMPGFKAAIDPAGEADLLAWLRGLAPKTPL